MKTNRRVIDCRGVLMESYVDFAIKFTNHEEMSQV